MEPFYMQKLQWDDRRGIDKKRIFTSNTFTGESRFTLIKMRRFNEEFLM